MFTWHEDREITPGVPDMHYGFQTRWVEGHREAYRIGWLELKAVDKLMKSNRIVVEPSQHQYITKWLPAMPIHFLIRVDTTIYLIHGEYHPVLGSIYDTKELECIATVWFPQIKLVDVLIPVLKNITRIL